MPTAYCAVEDVVTVASRFQALTTEETARVSAAIIQAQANVETMLGAFFYQAHLQVTTQSVQPRQGRLFLPHPCISIDTQGVVENGTALTQGTDFMLYQPTDPGGIAKGAGWIEKIYSPPTGLGTFLWSNRYWTNDQQGIVISGQFGFAAVPAEITKLTAYLAARLLGWISYTWTKGDGQSKASIELALPDWVISIKRAWRRISFDEQFFNIVVLP